MKHETVQQLQGALLSTPGAKLNAVLDPMDRMLERSPREILARAAYLITTQLGWDEAEQANTVIQHLSLQIYLEQVRERWDEIGRAAFGREMPKCE